MAEIYNRTLVETKAAMLLIPQSVRVLAKQEQDLRDGLPSRERSWQVAPHKALPFQLFPTLRYRSGILR